MAMYILSIAAQFWLSSVVLGDTVCSNSIYDSYKNQLSTYNFSCASYCCSSGNSYKYCCTDCTFSYYKVNCSALSPWVLGLIIFGCVVLLLIIVPAIAMAATKRRRVVRPIVINRDANSEDSDSDSAVEPNAAAMPPPPPSYSVQPPPVPSVPFPATPKSPRQPVAEESILNNDRPPSAMMPGSPPPFYSSRPATAANLRSALPAQTADSARERPAETRIDFDDDVDRSQSQTVQGEARHEENHSTSPPEYSADSQPEIASRNDESTRGNSNPNQEQLSDRSDVVNSDNTNHAVES